MPITVNDTIMPFKLDMGAQANLMSEANYRKLTARFILPGQECEATLQREFQLKGAVWQCLSMGDNNSRLSC